jgi:argininosuccinate lyase
MSKLWGGRFAKKTHKLVEAFGNSLSCDQVLAKYDCQGSLYHIQVLKRAGFLSDAEYQKLAGGLQRILKTIEDGQFFANIDFSFEDIHSYIQHCLEQDKEVGEIALKLHTCRSRNDQVVFDTKLYCLDHLTQTAQLIKSLTDVLKELGIKNQRLILPGFTHMQHAIPIRLGHYLDAYVQMLARDRTRLQNAFENIVLTLGAGALAGTVISFEHYRFAPDDALPKEILAPVNAIDTVSDRDFIIEILSALSIMGMHLSRLSEDMILWASMEFRFIDIDDAFCTGSSLMPQKKNPDVLELIRGVTGRLYGNQFNVMVMMKGLPLSYNRDMQHDKEPLFDSFRIAKSSLEILIELFRHLSFREEDIARQLDDEALYATDMADYLVEQGVPFKEAHHVVGQLIQQKYQTQTNILAMENHSLKRIHPLLTRSVLKEIIDPRASVSAKKSLRRIENPAKEG